MDHTLQKQAAPASDVRRRSIPVAQQKGAILDAAAKLFLEHGYEGVSIDAITALVGGSKRDIYRLFRNKESLFRAVIAQLATARVTLIRDVSAEGDLHTALTSMGVSILDILLAPETLALHRLMVAEAGRMPESAAIFLENVPLAAYRAVEELLRAHAATSECVMSDPEASAMMFVDALAGGLLLRALLGQLVSAEEIATKARSVVTHFFDGLSRPDLGMSHKARADIWSKSLFDYPEQG